MAKSPTIYVNDIPDAIRRIERYTKGMTRGAFGRDDRTQAWRAASKSFPRRAVGCRMR